VAHELQVLDHPPFISHLYQLSENLALEISRNWRAEPK
jgi:hypothetical protein